MPPASRAPSTSCQKSRSNSRALLESQPLHALYALYACHYTPLPTSHHPRHASVPTTTSQPQPPPLSGLLPSCTSPLIAGETACTPVPKKLGPASSLARRASAEQGSEVDQSGQVHGILLEGPHEQLMGSRRVSQRIEKPTQVRECLKREPVTQDARTSALSRERNLLCFKI